MQNDDVAKLFDECLPPETQGAISAALTRAYNFTESLIIENPLLGGELSRDIRPHIRRIIVDACLKELDAKVPGLSASIQWNAANNCQHVELHTSRIVLTASYVDEKGKLPRAALFRQAFAQALNMSLFADEPVEQLPIKPYGHLIHGGSGRKPAFIMISLPDAEGLTAVYSRRLEIAPLATDAPVEQIRDEVLSQLKVSQRNEGTGTL